MGELEGAKWYESSLVKKHHNFKPLLQWGEKGFRNSSSPEHLGSTYIYQGLNAC